VTVGSALLFELSDDLAVKNGEVRIGFNLDKNLEFRDLPGEWCT